MKYYFKEEGLEIKFSFKERLSLFFKGILKLNSYDSYKHSSMFMKLISDSIKKYGDSSLHGEIEADK